MSRTVCFWGTKKYSCTLDDNKKQKCGDVFEFSNRHLLLFCILIPLCNSATLYVSHHVLSMTNFYFHFFMRVFSIERSPQPLMKYEIIILSLSLYIHFQILTALGKSWHPEHFVCGVCSKPITEGSFNQRDGLPVCSPCYVSKYTDICHGCNQPILGVNILFYFIIIPRSSRESVAIFLLSCYL